MSALKVHEAEKTRELKWVAPKYYDYPDGEDLLGKLSYTLKYAVFASTFPGVMYANLPPKTDAVGKLVRMSKFIVPAAGMAATFTCVTFFSTRIRGKDDVINYLYGSIAAGAILGPAVGSIVWSFAGAVFLSTVGVAKKYEKMQGKTLLPHQIKPKKFASYSLRNLDLSLTPDNIRGNWTRDPPPK